MALSWSVDLPGQPSSGNELGPVTRFRRNRTGGVVAYTGIQKRQSVIDYQNRIVPVIRTAKDRPRFEVFREWAAAGLIRLTYDLFLARDMDCDNISKVVGDAIKVAIGVDDARFMPTFRTKITGVKEPHIVVTIEPFELCLCCGR